MSESEIRLERTAGFTVLQNDLIRDKRLSLKAKGLFAVLASLPPNWNYSVRGLCKVAGVGRDAIRSALSEMENAGYLDRRQKHGDRGKFSSCTYVIRDVSSSPPEEADAPLTGFPPTVSAPLTGFPLTGNPLTGNPPQINKEQVKKELSNPPHSPPAGDGVRRHRSPKSVPMWKPDRFEGLWNFYPDKGKKDRAAAVREWDRLKPDDVLIDQIARQLAKQKASDEWQRGIGIPYLCRYLSHQRWKDTVSQTSAPPPSGGWEADPEVM